MPNIALLLKAEISRIARKEVRAESQEWKKTAAQQRVQLAALRRRVETLERQVRRTTRPAAMDDTAEEEAAGPHRRFSAKGFAAQRRRLGLSAADMATLLGVTGQSIYKWELGKARPRARQLEAIASLRGIGKREAQARLDAMAAG